MLKFNSFRANRYLRSRFVEGKYLLASEASDIELELLEALRRSVESTLGSGVAIEDAWKVQKLSDTELLVSPGEAWVKGLPFNFRSGKDQLVSGAILSEGIVPVGVTFSDDASGLGKIITFNDSATTPTNLYRINVTAREELLTEVDDPFLQNANLTESTAQKVRLIFQINVIPDSLQTESPIPYRDEASSSLSTTNFPNVGGSAAPNLVNQIVITPTAAGNGELISVTPISGSEKIDGRDLEIVIRNDTSIGGGIILPNSPTAQLAFSNGTLVDSYGNSYHINQIFNDTISTQLVIRIDKEPDQPNPELVNTLPYSLAKREVFVTDDVNGSPQGKLYWSIATVDWHQTNGIIHESKVIDSRFSVSKQDFYQKLINQKMDMVLADGGLVSWDLASELMSWSSDFSIINPHGLAQTIATGSIPLVDGGSAVYEMDVVAGGAIARGTLAVSVSSAGATSTLSAVSLSDIREGNIVIDSGGVVAEITAIDDVNNTITTSPALSNTGAAVIYKDSYGPGKAPILASSFVLAVRSGNRIFIGDGLELKDGESSEIGSVPQQILDFIGATGDADDSPQYSSNNYVTDGDSLTTAIGDLDNQLGVVSAAIAADSWKAPVADFASLPPIGNTNGDVRMVLDTRVVYTWNTVAATWLETGRWKSPVATELSLPSTNNLDGDIRLVLDTRIIYSWNNTLTQWIPVSGSGGLIKVDFIDPISTTLPTGTSVTIDGVSGVNDDLVLFTNLSSNNNKVYKLGGVGVSLTWTPQTIFNGSQTPLASDAVIARKGVAFKQQIAIFNGTNFKVNDIVRYFDGVSGDFWEQSSIKTTTLSDNTTGNIFTVAFAGSENMVVKYSLLRGSIKETGELYLTTDGLTVAIARTNAYIGTSGVDFTAQIVGADLELNYQTSNLSTPATLKYFVSRWSDSAGGPTGIPSYTGGGGGGSAAAGSNTDIQYNNGGNLAGDNRFQWDSANGALDLNDLQYTVLSSSITLNDNQVAPANALTYNAASFRFAIIEYSVERDGDYRVGRMLVTNDGTNIGFSDDFVDTNSTGISFSANVSGANVQVQYASTSTGFTGSFKYSVRRWS